MSTKLFKYFAAATFLVFAFNSYTPAAEEMKPVSIHVFVALADLETQSIQNVAPRLAEGNNTANNIFWNAKYGVRHFLPSTNDWEIILSIKNYEQNILERVFFRHYKTGAIMVADAYRGDKIKSAILDFLNASSGGLKQKVKMEVDGKDVIFNSGGNADLLVYLGHNALMDFTLDPSELPLKKDDISRDAFVLAEYSKSHFELPVMGAGARPLLTIDGNILPEAYILHDAIEGYIAGEKPEEIRMRAVNSYVKYQSAGFNIAERLFKTF